MDAPGDNLAADPDVERTLGVGQRTKKRALRWVVLVVIAVIAIAAGVFIRSRPKKDGPQFESELVARTDLKVVVTVTGTLQTTNTVDVGAEISGRVMSVLVDYNDQVKKGQLLAEIDPVQLRADLNQSSAQEASSLASIAQAKATVDEARAALARAEEQAKQGLLATKDLEAARATAARAEASVASARASAAVARASVDSARWKLGKAQVLAPLDGIVLSRSIEPGQTVAASFTTPVLFKIAGDLTRMALHVQVDEADIGRVREGLDATFTVDAYPDRSFGSKVISVRNEAKTTGSVVTYEAVMTVDNSERLLRPGMTVSATIVTNLRTGVLAVPNAALRFSPPASGPVQKKAGTTESAKERQVWVLNGVTPTRVVVRTGASDGRLTEIVEGEITEGARVLTDSIGDE